MESAREFAVRYLNSIRGDLNPEDHVASFIAARDAAIRAAIMGDKHD